MLGCLGRVGCLAVLVVGGAAAWLARDHWWERVTGRPARPEIAWKTAADVREVPDPAALFARRNAPAFVSLRAPELAALLDHHGDLLLGAVDDVGVAISGDEVRVRARVELSRLPALDALGPAARLLEGRPLVELAGRPRVDSSRAGVIVVTDARVGGIEIPGAARAALLERLQGGSMGAGPGTIRFSLPAAVGDIRVAGGKVTVYRDRP